MGINTDKNSYTLLFAIGMVIIVGTLLAAIDSSLRKRIDTNKILEKQQNILYAIGINDNEGSSGIDTLFVNPFNPSQDDSVYVAITSFDRNGNDIIIGIRLIQMIRHA